MTAVDEGLKSRLMRGLAIPAHPLALTENRGLDEKRQAALTRYYCAAGAGGLAVGVHTTQFAIHDPATGLLDPVWRLAIENMLPGTVKVAGICGVTRQAAREAERARSLGYEIGLLSLGALRDAPLDELLAHCRAVSETISLFGFYLQPAVGGRPLGYGFWRRFFEIENVAAVKVAPFNRYLTVDVVRALGDSGRGGEIALYTGNDDNIVPDLLTDFVGGLLGHWAFWTKRAVELLERVHCCRARNGEGALALLGLSAETTDSNAAIFDAANGFPGCIPGIHEILRRQGLLAGRWCLDPAEELSAGQMDQIDRVCAAYPHLADDEFVAEHLDRWLL